MRRGRTIVVAHTLDLASRALAEARGLGVVALHLQPTILRSVHEVPSIGTKDISGWPRSLKRLLWWLVDRTYIDPPLAPGINQLRAELGLSPVSRIFAQHIHSPLLTLAMFPDWFAAPQPDWPPSLRQTMFPLYDRTGGTGCDQLEAFCAAGAPPVAFTPGSAFLFGQRFFQAAAQACEALGQLGLLLTSHVEQVPAPLPPNVIHVPFAPLSRILPLCAALVHHGGIGTTAAGLAAGVPQVIMPMSHDQPDNAARVMRLGVGERIMPKRFTGSSLGAALQRLLGSGEVRRRCAELAARCRAADGISQACDLIEQAAANA
jgi:UDP:flavonoid glycosyltransferase YjiC (YdhE family)